jgi:hypothetical protein
VSLVGTGVYKLCFHTDLGVNSHSVLSGVNLDSLLIFSEPELWWG